VIVDASDASIILTMPDPKINERVLRHSFTHAVSSPSLDWYFFFFPFFLHQVLAVLLTGLVPLAKAEVNQPPSPPPPPPIARGKKDETKVWGGTGGAEGRC